MAIQIKSSSAEDLKKMQEARAQREKKPLRVATTTILMVLATVVLGLLQKDLLVEHTYRSSKEQVKPKQSQQSQVSSALSILMYSHKNL